MDSVPVIVLWTGKPMRCMLSCRPPTPRKLDRQQNQRDVQPGGQKTLEAAPEEVESSQKWILLRGKTKNSRFFLGGKVFAGKTLADCCCSTASPPRRDIPRDLTTRIMNLAQVSRSGRLAGFNAGPLLFTVQTSALQHKLSIMHFSFVRIEGFRRVIIDFRLRSTRSGPSTVFSWLSSRAAG
ncbi:uncharacterized protein LY89DRAFT_692263 [Mollisia scopiformis]|uniref:Uncharacterized protein n=1 Tax=Mollisia scopiformis TaxID=149040 RepID=A0A132B2L5_MOLSC|nr:uncharacterized protein LY89DRAFT_692263 [Mollisia scopiformis]KUJ06632.1 hypothetical protein LY89DRAFT_692263 [Mollisia scopiformis]